VVGRAPALLAPRRVAALAALAVALGAYYALTDRLADQSRPWEVAFLALCLMPAVFALVWLALPLRHSNRLLLLTLALLVLTVILEAADLGALANFSKLAVMTTFAFWFLAFFESVLWVAAVALVIPIVDSISVWRGPTRHIVEEQPQPTSGSPTCSSSRCSSPPPPAGTSASAGRGSR
jgi:hypothetical protein